MPFEKLDNLMSGSLQRAGAAGKVRAAIVANTTLLVIKERFGSKTDQLIVRRFKDGKVTLVCGTSVLAEDIRLVANELIEEINHHLESDVVKQLVAVT
ncbi:hypothetical protein A2480_03950 [Candidatus Uhrbacteria bacterium RIFOXYC2_FULL_47_19]|uniref:Uncharacterized protein n=1 Tax=Candidatus Uhrbacteria bacterium RIFOXYC2_FULL_47_19 TaxID=1802424 RepID=A0A1F7WCT0_9BACT|nr:MAG: hypothetical protein A2480_03950 [Candidatus Uhrbacteria bacterium RIFOXYC2_FULL_47_19]HCC22196.1 hypothetical protein [Candidatus Uhrbacteria bacterium]